MDIRRGSGEENMNNLDEARVLGGWVCVLVDNTLVVDRVALSDVLLIHLDEKEAAVGTSDVTSKVQHVWSGSGGGGEMKETKNGKI